MSEVKSYFVRVYRPAALYEYEVEVDPDLIGMEDESMRDVSDDPATHAMRIALRKAKAGELEQRDNLEAEFVAILVDEETGRVTTREFLKEEP